MSTGYGWEGLRQVCATLLGVRRLCASWGAITNVWPLTFLLATRQKTDLWPIVADTPLAGRYLLKRHWYETVTQTWPSLEVFDPVNWSNKWRSFEEGEHRKRDYYQPLGEDSSSFLDILWEGKIWKNFYWRKKWRKRTQSERKTMHNLFVDGYTKNRTHKKCKRQTETDGLGRQRLQKTWYLEKRGRERTDKNDSQQHTTP